MIPLYIKKVYEKVIKPLNSNPAFYSPGEGPVFG
jgi:hypothetical protein